MSLLDKNIELLFASGKRANFKFDKELLDGYGYDDNDYKDFKIGYLREYIFDNWDKFTESADKNIIESYELTDKPEISEQIQLIHLGKRLDPNNNFASLDLQISTIFHVVVKPKESINLSDDESKTSKWKLHKKVQINPARRGSNSNSDLNSRIHLFSSQKRGSSSKNEPVPEFLETHRKSSSKQSNQIPELGSETIGIQKNNPKLVKEVKESDKRIENQNENAERDNIVLEAIHRKENEVSATSVNANDASNTNHDFSLLNNPTNGELNNNTINSQPPKQSCSCCIIV